MKGSHERVSSLRLSKRFFDVSDAWARSKVAVASAF
jgi:hypothetical protein